jgi:hypothetical protein
MQSAVRVGAFCVATSVALLAVGVAPVGAARKPITGTLSKPGFTVIALVADGRATSVRAPRGAFRLRPRAERVTLHLRAADGVYAGPIVIRGEGTRAILGVKAGARLGRIIVHQGYARLARRAASRWLDATRTARARRSVPIGAGVFGRVRAKPPRAAVAGDRDRDGIPDALDIDDDGDLILDNLDRSSRVDRSGRARAAQAPERQFNLISSLTLDLATTANANAAALAAQQMDAALASFGRLHIEILPGDSAELDCGRPQSRTDPGVGGLVYCTRAGTGRAFKAGSSYPDSARFPDCCDADGDGLGALTTTQGVAEPFFFLSHGATTAQIGTGDVLIERVTSGGSETQFASTLQYVFATVPALVSYDDGRGNSVTVRYPVPGPDPATGVCPLGPPPCSGPGTRENPFPVAARPNGDVVVALKFWRPQRRPIAPETGDWIDMGRVNYTAGIADVGLGCPSNAFSETDPDLTPRITTPADIEDDTAALADQAPDRPASPANTFTYTLNLTRCLAAHGRSFNPGQAQGFGFRGFVSNGSDDAQQYVSFKRQ